MAEIKILKGSKISQQPVAQPEIQESSGYQPGLFGRLGLQALKGVESPLRGISSLLEYLGEPGLIKGKTTSENIMSKYNISPQQIEPQSLPENIAHKAAQLVPTSLALGGVPAALSTAIGSVPSGTAQYLGAPEPVQDILQLGTELGRGLYTGKIPTVGAAQTKEYELARAAIPEAQKAAAKPVLNAILNVTDKLKTEVDKGLSSKIYDAISVIENNIKQKKINPNTALDLRRKLHQFRRVVPKNAQFYIDDLASGVNDFFAAYSAQNPKFFNHLKTADKLTEMKHMQSYITDFAENILPGGKAKLLALPVKYTLGGVEKFVRNVYKNPVARKYYLETVKAAVHQDPALFVKQLNNFDNIYEQEFTPKSFKEADKFKILRGKKL